MQTSSLTLTLLAAGVGATPTVQSVDFVYVLSVDLGWCVAASIREPAARSHPDRCVHAPHLSAPLIST
jgi:hypothetical protein